MPTNDPSLEPVFGGTRPARQLPLWCTILALAVMVAAGTAIRIDYTHRIPSFDPASSAGFLQTDSAFLAYLTDRIVEAGGGIPDDFRHDARIEHPETTDIPAMFTVGQEFVIAWAKLLVGERASLHVVAVWVMSLFAALVAVGVFGVGRELTASRAWGLGAALVWMSLPASYRTLGFVFIREDFSLPIYALHLWLVLRAARLRTGGAYLAAGASAALAAATWHAMGQFLAMEMGCLVLWFLRSGQNPFQRRGAWLAVAAAAAVALAVPVLRAKFFVLSAPSSAALALLAAGLASRRWPGRWRARCVFGGTFATLLGAAMVVARVTGSGLSDYAHVFELVWAKIVHLGELPADPSAVSFDTRMLWQGPFVTAELSDFTLRLGLVLLPVVAAVCLAARHWITGRGDGRAAVLAAFALATCASAWLISRTYVVTAIAASAAAAAVLAAVRVRYVGVAALLIIAARQGLVLYDPVLSHPRGWWDRPDHTAERALLVDWVRDHVPPDEAIASDYVTSASLLYHTRRPSLLQPKYETVRSRRRIEALFTLYFHGKPADLRAWLEAHDCRWFVLDQWWMWQSRYVGGFVGRRPEPYTNAAWFHTTRGEVPGFELMYRSPARFKPDNFRVYRLLPHPR